MTNENNISANDILTEEITKYDQKIAELKGKNSHAKFDVDSLNYTQGRRDGISWVKLLLQDLKKQ